MQKAEGSSPFSRLIEEPCKLQGFFFAQMAPGESNFGVAQHGCTTFEASRRFRALLLHPDLLRGEQMTEAEEQPLLVPLPDPTTEFHTRGLSR